MNFGEMVAQIADDLVDERLTNVQIQNAINQALRFYSRKTFYFNTTKETITTVANQEYYSVTSSNILVADLYTLQTVRYQNATSSVALLPMQDSTLENVSVTGGLELLPRTYAYSQMRIRLYPKPKEAGTLTIIATKMIPRLVADPDTNVFLSRADELIRQAAKRYISFNVLHDQAMGDRFASLESEEFASLVSENRNREPDVLLHSPRELVMLSGGCR